MKYNDPSINNLDYEVILKDIKNDKITNTGELYRKLEKMLTFYSSDVEIFRVMRILSDLDINIKNIILTPTTNIQDQFVRWRYQVLADNDSYFKA